MSLRTPICDLLGIEYPIFAAGMGGVTMAPLAGAVSAAGGMGVLGATFCTPDELRAEIRAVRRITERPFGVDLMFPVDIPPDLGTRQVPPLPEFLRDMLPRIAGLAGTPPPPLTLELARAQLEVVLTEKVPLLASGLGTPAWMIEACHRAGTKVLSLVGSARQAKKLEQAGVDIIVAQGMEAGGHVGSITTMVLVPAVVDAVRLPVLAAGGITDGRGIAAGMMLGAQGAWIGTRFIATPEATAHANHKRRILDVDEDGTVISRCYTGKTSRVLKNEFTERWKGRDAELLPMPWQRMQVESLVAPAKAAGLMDVANFPTGQGAGAIRDLLPARELFARLLGEATKALGR